VHRAATTVAKPVACAKLPELSPKIPALPAGLPCAKPLYSITTIPTVKLENVSPMEDAKTLGETLGIESSTFSLDYVDIKIGSGPLAQPHKWYSIHYTGYLTDGTKFDSSLDRNEPIDIPYGGHQVIPGWDTGFDGMHVGGKRRLFIPFQLAYGAQGKPPVIPARAELIFDVELVGMSDTKPEKKTPPAPEVKPGTPAAPGSAAPTQTPGTAPGSNPTLPPAKPTTPPASTTPPPATPPTSTPGAAPGSNPTVPSTTPSTNPKP
jgi:peptidylprolyl isomerase